MFNKFAQLYLAFSFFLMASFDTSAAPADHLVIQAKTDIATLGDKTFRIVISPSALLAYNYRVDWEGDGIFDNINLNANITHTYATAGTYTIRIAGDFPEMYFASQPGDVEKIISVDQWGTQIWNNMNVSFANAKNLVLNASDVPNLSVATNLNSMFANAPLVGTGATSWIWNTTTITNMTAMFSGATSFDEDISSWNVANVAAASNMFDGVTLSNTNYDALLISWEAQMLQNGVTFSGGDSQYCSQVATVARQDIINVDNWVITDGNRNPACINQAPTILTSSSISTLENQADVVIITSSDPESDTVTYSITGGNDQALFSINPTTGQLSFILAPDFETPNSNAGTNSYEATITATDDGSPNEPSSKAISIMVTNVLGDEPGEMFRTTWKTDNLGVSNDTSITIQTDGSKTYSYQVDWNGDYDFDDAGEGTIWAGDATHDYGAGNEGTYTINIFGLFPRLKFLISSDSKKILSIDRWGINQWESMHTSFQYAVNLINKATDTPDLTNCQSLAFMFIGSEGIGGPLDTGNWDWDVSNITNMSKTFKNATNFDKDLSFWNIENVTHMEDMFEGATLSSANYDAILISWDGQNVQTPIEFDGGNSQYCSQAATDARQSLIDNDVWTFTDGERDPSCFIDEIIFTNGFEDVVIIKTTALKVDYNFSNISTEDLSDTALLIIKGLDNNDKENLQIHLRNDLGQLQIRLSNKIDGQWQQGIWENVNNTSLTTIHWTITGKLKNHHD